VVRTSASHAGNTSSNLVGVTATRKPGFGRAFLFGRGSRVDVGASKSRRHLFDAVVPVARLATCVRNRDHRSAAVYDRGYD